MRIALIGFGAMGKVVGWISNERGHEVVSIVDPGVEAKESPGLKVYSKISAEALSGVDVAIDFSSASALMENLATCKKAGVNLVVGSTGWYERMEEVKEIVLDGSNSDLHEKREQRENQTPFGFLWSSNFSIGVNLYFRMVEAAAKMMDKFDEYDIWGHEIHHYNKADSPSGTAKTLEKILLENIARKDSVVEEKLDRRREMNEIHFSSVRGGPVNFGHTIGFDSAADRILISHEARCRDGYALGAVKAAEWLVGKKGFFGMEDFLEETLGAEVGSFTD